MEWHALWQAYLRRFVQDDGRVIDDQHQSRYTTSEGQAYTLFFALVADDRDRFETLLRWTDVHLARGRLGGLLPGWRWGRRDDGRWTLVDDNPASDADLWLVHTLFEAARLWSVPRWRDLAQALLAEVKRREVIELGGWGPALLPGPRGFMRPDGTVRLNPSYAPLHQLRALAREDADPAWSGMAERLPDWLRRVGGPHGLPPDWVLYHRDRGWHAGEDAPAVASYDAVRCPLWAGLASPEDPLQPAVRLACRGWWQRAVLPERWDLATGGGEGQGPAGFAAALLPAWPSAEAPPEVPTLDGGSLLGRTNQPPRYYDQVLGLFGLGAVQGRFRFDRDGRLQRRLQ